MAAAVEVDHLSKTFKLYHEKHTSIKERVLHIGRTKHEKFQALDDVNLSIESGETIGLLGHNGSGKSTLLKCIAGILQPSAGAVRTVGRMAALLELGAGFHPDLTGRENVYMNASILGMKRIEIDKIFDDIVGFAELEQFIDMPVKHYSSGMYIRLGFAVAINVDPDVLLVDEVLSVGDEAFQRKCLDRVRTFQAEGRTIVVVTHAAELVRTMCDRGAALDHGKLIVVGEPNDVIREFRERLMAGVTSDQEVGLAVARSELSPAYGKIKIRDVRVVYAQPDGTSAAPGEPVCFDVDVESQERIDDVVVAFSVFGSMGQYIYGTNSFNKGTDVGPVDGMKTVRIELTSVPLLDGVYAITIGVHTRGGLMYDLWEQKRRFEVTGGGRDEGLVALPVQVSVQVRS